MVKLAIECSLEEDKKKLVSKQLKSKPKTKRGRKKEVEVGVPIQPNELNEFTWFEEELTRHKTANYIISIEHSCLISWVYVDRVFISIVLIK